jgi:hypothetical protein
MLKTSIHSQQNGNALLINGDGSINTFVIPKPPAIDQIALPFSQYLTIDGTELTSSSMLVDGSTNNVDFFIGAKSFDIYINTLVFSIVDANASMAGFGNLAALTNGLEFFYFNQANGKYTIESGLKSLSYTSKNHISTNNKDAIINEIKSCFIIMNLFFAIKSFPFCIYNIFST